MNMIIFTDGSSRGNPGKGGYAGIIIVEDEKVIEIGGKDDHTTNNRMEMTGALMALRYVNKNFDKLFSDKKGVAKITLYTDSAYLLNGATKWSLGWKKNNWITSQKEEVLNRDIWEALLAEIESLEGQVDLKWRLVKGHSGLSLNERCDVIATSFADGVSVDLYNGAFDKYEYAKSIADVEKEIEEARPSKSSKTNSKAPAYSYVSAVDGKIETHKTWAECEKRVKGTSGARFKKSLNKTDEAAIIKSFK